MGMRRTGASRPGAMRQVQDLTKSRHVRGPILDGSLFRGQKGSRFRDRSTARNALRQQP